MLSPRNAHVAVADMLQRTGATHLVVSGDAFMSGTAREAVGALAASGVDVAQLAMPAFEDLFAESLDPRSAFAVEAELPQKFDLKAHGIILHSSGACPC